MNNLKKEIDMDFTKTQFPEGIHMCLIYDRDEDRQKIVSEYMAAGLKQGEQVRYLTDTTAPEVVHSWLLEMGVELPEGKIHLEGTQCRKRLLSERTFQSPRADSHPAAPLRTGEEGWL